MKKHELIEQELCKEIDKMENGLRNGQAMTMEDLKKLDLMFHTLKDISTYNAMNEAKEYEGSSGTHYMSRDNGSYEEGYNRGYSAAMNQNGGGNSGHYPVVNPYYPEPRRW